MISQLCAKKDTISNGQTTNRNIPNENWREPIYGVDCIDFFLNALKFIRKSRISVE